MNTSDYLAERPLPNGKVAHVVPLFGGRARIIVSDAGNMQTWRDGY
jgi:hypothetical protein